MICCFTGHRNIDARHILQLPALLDDQIERLIVCGVDTFRGGGAVGFDMLAQLKVIEKKKKYPFVKLHLILPCRDQTKKWSEHSRAVYDYIASEADSIEYVADLYTPTCMKERNRRLVDGSDFCLAFAAKKASGSSYTISYAQKKDVPVINLYEKIKS